MYPELFSVGGFSVYSFGVMLALAFITAGFVAHRQFKRRGVEPDLIFPLLIAAVIGGLAGAKVHFLVLHPDQWPGNLLTGGGLVWSGGFFGAVIAVIIVALIARAPLPTVFDAGAPAVALGHAVGRLGSFLRGDDYGVPTDLPWGMAFPEGLPPTMVKVHPTQLYESLASLVIFCILVWLVSPRVRREGVLIFVYAVLAGMTRFLVEFVRVTEGTAAGLTQQQWISLVLVVLGMGGIWWFGKKGRHIARPREDIADGESYGAPVKGAEKG